MNIHNTYKDKIKLKYSMQSTARIFNKIADCSLILIPKLDKSEYTKDGIAKPNGF